MVLLIDGAIGIGANAMRTDVSSGVTLTVLKRWWSMMISLGCCSVPWRMSS